MASAPPGWLCISCTHRDIHNLNFHGDDGDVQTLIDDQQLIALMTGIELHVVAQYYDPVEKYRPEKLLKSQSLPNAQVAGQLP